jgi:large subunit ribosomal protein L37e
MKGTPSMGRRNKTGTHMLCRRCGKRAMHKSHGVCASCGFGKTAHKRKFTWNKKNKAD